MININLVLGVCFCFLGAGLLEDRTTSLYLGYRLENMRIGEEPGCQLVM
jgi:hypothetical protein